MKVPIFLVIYMTLLTLFFSLTGCFEPQPQYINTKDDNSHSEDNSGEETQENQDNNPNDSTSESDSNGNTDNSDNSDNTNGEQEPSSEPELPTYSGGYNVNLCSPEKLKTTGYAVGQVAGDFELIDQYGENLRLSDFCGNTVLLVAVHFGEVLAEQRQQRWRRCIKHTRIKD